MNNSAKYACCILCLIFVIVILIVIIKDIIMDNNEKSIQENFRGGGGGRGGGFSGGMGGGSGMRGAGFSGSGRMGGTPQRSLQRAGIAGATVLGGRHIYNRAHGWDHHRSNYYRPYFVGAPLWYWNNGTYNNDGYYSDSPDIINYNFYDAREGEDNNYN
jgi:hypothetical protein